MGLQTVNVTTGKVTTEEIRDVKHQTQTVYEKLKESKVNQPRELHKTRRSQVQEKYTPGRTNYTTNQTTVKTLTTS